MFERAGWSIGAVLALMLMAAVLQLTIPEVLNQAADTLSDYWLRSFGIGLAALAVLPLDGLILIVTILGIPLGLLLWLVFTLLGTAGLVVASYWLGLKVRSLFDRSLEEPGYGGRLWWTLIGFIGLGLINWVPWVGSLAVWLIEIAALGALLISAWVRFRTPRPVSAAI